MTTFVHENPKHGFTENGAPAHSHDDVGDSRVVLAFALVRGLEGASGSAMLNQVLRDAKSFGGLEFLMDLLVLVVQTRDVRHGKGERDLSFAMIRQIADELPVSASHLIRLLPEFGCWKDVRTLWSLSVCAIEDDDSPAVAKRTAVRLVDLCRSMFVEQLNKDVAALADAKDPRECKELSLCGKWAPREKSASARLARDLAEAMFPATEPPAGATVPKHASALRKYRQMLSKLNKALDTVEVKMCAKRFREVSPKGVPSRALAVYRRAFLNLKLKSNEPRSTEQDRIVCAQRFSRHANADDTTMHGRTLFPHELVKSVMARRHYMDSDELKVIQKQWEDLVNSIRENDEKARSLLDVQAMDGEVEEPMDEQQEREAPEQMNAPLGGRYVPLVDVSGSMSGLPMEVAIAMGILLSEVAHPAFAHRFLSFESQPRWVKFNPTDSLADKVETAARSPWGGSTDFTAAIRKILQSCVQYKVKPEDMPQAMFVFSDMQFDVAEGCYGIHGNRRASQERVSKWNTAYETLREDFKRAGYPRAPVVVFWNVRANTTNMPCRAAQEGVVTCSGYSAAMLKFFLEKDIIQEIDEKERLEREEKAAKEAAEVLRAEAARLKKLKAESEVLKKARTEAADKVEEEESGGFVVMDQDVVTGGNTASADDEELEKQLEAVTAAQAEAEKAEAEALAAATKAGITPMGMLRSMLDHERYAPVRALPDADEAVREELKEFLGGF